MTVLAASVSGICQAQVYKWKDAQGNMHYSDTPPMDVKNIETKNVKANVVDTDAQPFATKLAAEKNPVSLYSFTGCGEPCTKAQAYLDKRGIPYALKNTDEDKAALQKLTGSLQVPVLVVGSKIPKRGFLEESWASLLDEAGYPKDNPLAAIKKPAKPVPAEAAPN
ncbi:glutaredoxin family protein [Methyloradius palustris]|nr:glutaredoxin family protein [Methyloradius palustris]